MNQCFKIKRGTDYDKAIKNHFELLPKWENVYKEVSSLLGEDVTNLAFIPDELYIDLTEIKNPENKKLFTKDGKLKGNLKKANDIREEYKKIIEKLGLSGFEELRFINFAYGVMRTRGQNLESYRTSENDIYYKADFDLEQKTKGLVIPVTEIEYQEKYLKELKKQK